MSARPSRVIREIEATPERVAEAGAIAEELLARGARVPRATYRVQLCADMRFADVRAAVEYLDALGVSDVYTSPFFRAREGSTHGYDLADHNAIEEAIGTRRDLDALASDLAARGMAILLDFVPNHMGVGTRLNAWWNDVLENGPSSPYASHFDIDWKPLKTELADKVLLPILGDHYGSVLEQGQLEVRYEGGAFVLCVYDKTLPINPRTFPAILGRVLSAVAAELGEEDDATLELMSIVTGLSHLPPITETKRSKVMERRREKEVLKRRLATLVAESEEVATALRRALDELNGEVGDPKSFDALDALLEQQAYRLSYRRVAHEEINYRRFFDINDLAAIRVENPRVFDEAHRLLFELVADERIKGVRVDHPDGLWDPRKYFEDLQRGALRALVRKRLGGVGGAGMEAVDRAFDRAAMEGDGRPLYVVAEKILARGEALPTSWLVHGTTGYDFAAVAGRLFVDETSEEAMSDVYERFTRRTVDFTRLVYEKKKLILATSLASELNVLARALNRFSERDRHSRDFTLGVLTDALREVIACFPVYRTYVDERTETLAAHDRAAMLRAIRLARRRNPTTDRSVYAFLKSILLLEPPRETTDETEAMRREIVMKLQQLTSPVTAKGVEDTAFYVFNRLVSLNEVGAEPERWGSGPGELHAANAARLERTPFALLATSTHDTKRSEDVRARISVLSEIPSAWEAGARELARRSKRFKTEVEEAPAPDLNEEYLFYQTLVGTWPGKDALSDEYVSRVVSYLQKAAKEAKVNTSWIDPEPDYDRAIETFITGVIREAGVEEALGDVLAITSRHGRYASLAEQLLKLTSPGVPDIYQGTEVWGDSLVDPDNRRRVRFDDLRAVLTDLERTIGDDGRLAAARAFARNPEDDRAKMFVVRTALALRREAPELFGARGAYRPLAAHGAKARHVFAFARSAEGRQVVVVVPRLTASLVGGSLSAPVGEIWKDTFLDLERGAYTDRFTERRIDFEGGPAPLDRIFSDFPLGLLVR